MITAIYQAGLAVSVFVLCGALVLALYSDRN